MCVGVEGRQGGVPGAPPPKNVEPIIMEYVDCKKGTFFSANNLLIAKFP